MKRLVCFFLSLMMIVCTCTSCVLTSAYNNEMSIDDQTECVEQKILCQATLEDNFAEDRILVVLKHEESLKFKKYTTEDFSDINCKSVVDLSSSTEELVKTKLDMINNGQADALNQIQRNYPVVCINTDAYNKILYLELAASGKDNVLKAIKQLEKRSDVLSVCPDYIITACDVTPNDTYYKRQTSSTSLTDLHKAWEVSTGSSKVLVGVLDTGIDYNNPDIKPNMNISLSKKIYQTTVEDFTEPYDPNGHGTHVAGIIGAKGNNSTGITGVCWNVTLVGLRVLDSNKQGFSSSVVTAMDYAAQNNIMILNLSAHWNNSGASYNAALDAAIKMYPGLVVCSAGNEGENLDTELTLYPQDFLLPNLITVAACNGNYMCYFTNYGKERVNLFAPGQNILSCFRLSYCVEGKCEGYYGNNGSEHFANGYHYDSGTSMAAPFVTGVAALLLSKYPTMTAAELKHTILGNVSNNLYNSSGEDAFAEKCTSGGILNAYKALSNPIYGDHKFTYVNVGLATGHITSCAACGESRTVAHKWSKFTSYYQCAECKVKTTSLPEIISNNQTNE